MRRRKNRGEERTADLRINYYLNTLIELVNKMYGEQAGKLIKHIVESGGSAPEETIGKDTGVKSNEARKILQKLGNEALLTCRPRKAGDKVLHFWHINWDQVENMLINRLRKTREKLVSLLQYEESNIVYECPVCKRRFSLDQVFEYEFRCPHDNEILVETNKIEVTSFLKKKIEEVDRELSKLGV